jgi:hypothetical protein
MAELIEGLPPHLRDGAPGRGLYMLAVVDEETGAPVRPATREDVEELPPLLALDPAAGGKPRPRPPSALRASYALPQRQGQPTLQELLAEATRGGRGPVCCHCSATESPQWRRGTHEKPLVCNACGTRFRRLGNFGPATPGGAGPKKRPPSAASIGGACGRGEGGEPASKHPRMVAAA